MAVLKQAVFLLLLLAVSTYADHHEGHADHGDHADHGNHTDHADHADHADHGNHTDHADQKELADRADCENLNRVLHSKDLHKSFGDWVLVSSVADQREALDFLRNLSSSHIELRLLNDNKTVSFKEWNKHNDGSCASYFIKSSLAENRADLDHHTLPVDGYHLEKNGVVERHNETGEFQFFQSCDNSLRVVFKVEEHRFLLNYVREGHHRNVTQLRAHDDRHDRQAKCLGFSHEEMFRYDGSAEPCHKETPQAFKEHLEHRGINSGSDPNGQEL